MEVKEINNGTSCNFKVTKTSYQYNKTSGFEMHYDKKQLPQESLGHKVCLFICNLKIVAYAIRQRYLVWM